MLTAAPVVNGILRIAIAASHRPMRGCWGMLLGGVVRLLVGILIVHRVTWLQFSLLLREAARATPA